MKKILLSLTFIIITYFSYDYFLYKSFLLQNNLTRKDLSSSLEILQEIYNINDSLEEIEYDSLLNDIKKIKISDLKKIIINLNNSQFVDRELSALRLIHYHQTLASKDFVLDDLLQILKQDLNSDIRYFISINNDSDRVKNIIKSLEEFSDLDQVNLYGR